MKCVYCNCTESRVIDSRQTDDGCTIRRRRECEGCGRRFTTYEKIDTVPLMVISAMAGALCSLLQGKGKTAQKLGLSIIIGGALSNLYDRLARGYVVDYFSIEWDRLKKVVFNLGDMFVFLGSAVIVAEQVAVSLAETAKKVGKK